MSLGFAALGSGEEGWQEGPSGELEIRCFSPARLGSHSGHS